jgi:hypothetical protein
MGLDTKIYWLTDRQSQCNFDFDFDFGSRYQATVSEDWEHFIYAVVTVIFGVCNSVKMPHLFVVTELFKNAINPITYPNPVSVVTYHVTICVCVCVWKEMLLIKL